MIHHRRRFRKTVPHSIIASLTALVIFSLSLPAWAVQNAPATFADLAEKLGPTVVNIYTTQVVGQSGPYHDFSGNEQEIPEMFRRFFGFPHPGKRAPRRPQERTNLGSGVIISKDGYIATNNHMVEGANKIKVRLTNFEEYDAEIIGRDPKTDLALIKIMPKHVLPYVEFGNSEALRVGDWVIAIGNPFGFEQTVTAGIVSGKGRSLGSGPYENFIQTDASINPGNSGGPLFNLEGKMVGINTAIYSRSGGNIGIGFAIPVNMARSVITQLKETGTVVRGWLGVMIQHVTPELAEEFGLQRPIGALVGEVTPDSPASKGGVLPGDVIIKFNGKEITQMSMLPAMVAQTPVNSKAAVDLIREGKKKKVTVTIKQLKEDQTVSGKAVQDSVKDFGLSVQELTPELAQSLGVSEKSGLLVANVARNSSAFRAGLRRGDLILEANRKQVTSLRAFNALLRKTKKGGIIRMLIKRDDHTRFVALKKE